METKSESEDISLQKWADELFKNCNIVLSKYKQVNSLLHQSTPNIEQSKIDEERCKIDKFELVASKDISANGDLSMVAYGTGMHIVRRELQVHISHLCYILCEAAETYYQNNKGKFNFINYSLIDDIQ